MRSSLLWNGQPVCSGKLSGLVLVIVFRQVSVVVKKKSSPRGTSIYACLPLAMAGRQAGRGSRVFDHICLEIRVLLEDRVPGRVLSTTATKELVHHRTRAEEGVAFSLSRRTACLPLLLLVTSRNLLCKLRKLEKTLGCQMRTLTGSLPIVGLSPDKCLLRVYILVHW